MILVPALLTLYIVTFVIGDVQSLKLKVIPESVKLLERNDKYVKWLVLNIRRYQRSGDYYLNISFHISQTMGNNVTIQIVLTEYLHNEYRPSFIQVSYKLCDFINKEPFIGGMIKKSGIICPLQPGEYHLMNMTVQSDNFPNVFPFDKGGANVELKLTDTREIVARFEYHAKFVHNKT